MNILRLAAINRHTDEVIQFQRQYDEEDDRNKGLVKAGVGAAGLGAGALGATYGRGMLANTNFIGPRVGSPGFMDTMRAGVGGFNRDIGSAVGGVKAGYAATAPVVAQGINATKAGAMATGAFGKRVGSYAQGAGGILRDLPGVAAHGYLEAENLGKGVLGSAGQGIGTMARHGLARFKGLKFEAKNPWISLNSKLDIVVNFEEGKISKKKVAAYAGAGLAAGAGGAAIDRYVMKNYQHEGDIASKEGRHVNASRGERYASAGRHARRTADAGKKKAVDTAVNVKDAMLDAHEELKAAAFARWQAAQDLVDAAQKRGAGMVHEIKNRAIKAMGHFKK